MEVCNFDSLNCFTNNTELFIDDFKLEKKLMRKPADKFFYQHIPQKFSDKLIKKLSDNLRNQRGIFFAPADPADPVDPAEILR